MKPIKLACVGGGGLRTLGIVRDWLRREALARDTEVVIMDINQWKADVVAGLCAKMPEAHAVGARCRATTDLADAVDGADFVYVLVRVGQVAAMEEDKRIGVKYGFHGHDDFGPAGFMLTVRTVPVMLNIAREMEQRCPDAWMFIFTNPEPTLVDAVDRYSSVKALGLCSGSRNVRYDVNMALRAETDDERRRLQARPETEELAKDVAQVAGAVPYWDMDYRVAGINHLGWAYECTWEGKDIYPEMIDRVLRADLGRLPEWMHWYLEMVELYGRFIFASGHCFHWFYHQRMVEQLAASLDPSKRQRSQVQDDATAEAAKLLDEDLGDGFWEQPLLARMGAHKDFDDIGVGMMAAMLANTGDERAVTVPNHGMVSNLPEGSPVEVTVRVDGRGVHALPPADVPHGAESLLHAILAHQRMVVDVAVDGTRRDLLAAILADPVQRNRDVAERMMDELLAANRPWLPAHLQ